MAESEYKVLSDLRVTELKVELEKRGLDKNGIKIILSDRLEKAIRADGQDPATYKFCVSETPATPAKQKSTTPAPEKVSEPVSEEVTSSKEPEAPGEVATEEELKPGNAEVVVPVADPPEGPKAPKATDEEQLDDPLDDKHEHVKAATAPAVEKKEDDISRSFWVRGITAATKAADLREKFSAFGTVARAKIFTSKKDPGKTFGLLTMTDVSFADACISAMHGKEWNGVTITIEKGSQANLTPAKTTAAANTAVKKVDPIVASAKSEQAKRERTPEPKKERSPPASPPSHEKGRHLIVEEKPRSPKVTVKEEKPREKIRHPADRIAPSSVRIRREPIRSARQDIRKTISAARTVTSRSGGMSSRTSALRASTSLVSRISRPALPFAARRPDTYSSNRTTSSEVERMREELRRRENDRQLERERERLRIEREKIEREKLELQVLQQRQQLAALKASMEGPRTSRGESRHDSSRTSSARDRHTSSRTSRPEPRRDASRDNRSRPDERRPQMSSGDRSRSRHDGHSRQDGHVRSEMRQESHMRSEPRHESRVRNETRYDNRSEVRHDSSRHGGSTGRTAYPSRDAPSTGVSGQSNYYGSRASYASASREFEPSRGGTTGTSWGQANWAGLPTDNWGVRNGGSGGDWSSSGGYNSGSGASNIRIDYDKYHRQQY